MGGAQPIGVVGSAIKDYLEQRRGRGRGSIIVIKPWKIPGVNKDTMSIMVVREILRGLMERLGGWEVMVGGEIAYAIPREALRNADLEALLRFILD